MISISSVSMTEWIVLIVMIVVIGALVLSIPVARIPGAKHDDDQGD